MLEKKIARKFEGHYDEQASDDPSQVGKTSIYKKPPSEKKSKDSTGEYIDYEEVND